MAVQFAFPNKRNNPHSGKGIAMGREVRKVPKDWQHPKGDNGRYIPLFEGRLFAAYLADFQSGDNENEPHKSDFMPDWPESEKTHFMMYENTSEGTPISPAFETPELLARWLADNGASSFGRQTASYEAWLRVARGGFAPSMVMTDGGLTSCVEGLSK